jgi:DtxR family Mn-dependent transcriptional regulator
MISRTIEDYLEAILNLIEKRGEARTKDIADTLDIKPPSVTEMVQKLSEERLVNYKRYSATSLTAKGKRIASRVKEKREIIVKLLKTIQIPKEVAKRDACLIGHQLNPTTVEQLRKFVNFVENASVSQRWIRHFKEYSETGECPPECRVKQR